MQSYVQKELCRQKHGVHSMFSWSWPLWTISSGWMEVELEMDLEMELTPQSAQHGWRWSQTWSWTPTFTSGKTHMGLEPEIEWNPQKVEHEYESRDGSGNASRDIVDPLQNQLRLDAGAARHVELTPNLHLRWDMYGAGTRDRVDPQKVEHKYESGDGSRNGVDPQSAQFGWRWSQTWSWPLPLHLS